MNEAVFIADLHLNPHQNEITEKFYEFCSWARTNTKKIYILGDFFHVWAGDDAIDSWSMEIAKKLANLVDSGIKIYFLPGNRDFLICKKFANLAKIQLLRDPCVITLDKHKVVLTHGDRYCSKDTGHQVLRFFTRNRLFTKVFLCLPLILRKKIVNKVRYISQNNQKKAEKLRIVPENMLNEMYNLNSRLLIHGHIHQPGILKHDYKDKIYQQFTVSDWDDRPIIVCYNESSGMFLDQVVRQ